MPHPPHRRFDHPNLFHEEKYCEASKRQARCCCCCCRRRRRRRRRRRHHHHHHHHENVILSGSKIIHLPNFPLFEL
jgi:hypothetical protein